VLLAYFAYKQEDRERTEIAAAADIVVIPGEDEWKMYELSFWCLIICKFIYI
jgi:NADPH-dependent 7-cyano-7-deazaguanine reductase QueF-like protein